jgi:hypothetical protein
MSEPLFGGLLKAGDAARVTIERELHRRVEAWGPSPALTYRGPADFILQHGRYYAGRVIPAEYEHLRGPNQHCFMNTLEACEQHPELTYTEGVYMVRGTPTAHAWPTGPDGLPVELTFPTDPDILAISVGGVREGYTSRLPYQTTEHWAYYGVQFPHVTFVRDYFERFALGMIELAECGWPLLRQSWTPLVKRLPSDIPGTMPWPGS